MLGVSGIIAASIPAFTSSTSLFSFVNKGYTVTVKKLFTVSAPDLKN
jgi:hypothetical protein